MRLLDPQDQKDAETTEELESRKKLAEISSELTKGVKALNEFRSRDEAERGRIEAEHSDFLSKKNQEKAKLSLEIAALENRWKEALLPLNKIKAMVVDCGTAFEKRERECSAKESALALEQSKVRELADGYAKKFDELKDFERELNDRKLGLDEEKWRFDAMMKYRSSAIDNDHKKLRAYFEEESRKLKNK